MILPLQNSLGALGHRPFGQSFGGGSALLTNLDHYWRMDEGVAQSRVDQIGGVTLLNNSIGAGVGTTTGPMGTAATFVKEDRDVLMKEQGAGNFLISDVWNGPWTIGGWLYYDFGLNSTGLYEVTLAGAGQFSIRAYFAHGTTIYAYVGSGNAGNWGNTNGFVNQAWNYVLLWCDSREIWAQVGTNAPASGGVLFAAPANPTSIAFGGGYLGVNNWSTCGWQHFGIWSRLLTADERTTLAGGFDPTA